MMHRHLIAGALACFGSNLLAQSTDSTANQQPSTLNTNQGTLQNGLNTVQGGVDRGGQQYASPQNPGRAYPLRRDASGRTFICVNGQPVYMENTNSTSVQGNTGTQGQYRSGYGSYDSQNARNGYDLSRDGNAAQPQQQGWEGGQGNLSPNSQDQANGAVERSGNGEIQSQAMQPQGWATQGSQSSNQGWNSGRAYTLRHDASGREFICVNGRPVYFDNVNSTAALGNSPNQTPYRSGYGSYDNGQRQGQQQGWVDGQNGTRDENRLRSDDPSNQFRNQQGLQTDGNRPRPEVPFNQLQERQGLQTDGNRLRSEDPSSGRTPSTGELDSQRLDRESSTQPTESGKNETGAGLPADNDTGSGVKDSIEDTPQPPTPKN